MFNADTLQRFRDILGQSQTVLVLLGNKPSLDQIATALAMQNALLVLGKDVELASASDSLGADSEQLEGVEQVKNKIGNQQLTISFPYQEEAVDKVSYHISDDNQTFYLVVKPRKGQKPLPAEQVEFDYLGAEADMVILIGVHDYDQLEHLYEGYPRLYDTATIVTIHTFEPTIGAIKFDVSQSTSMSEAAVWLLESLGAGIDAASATNLLYAIEQTTNNLQSLTTTADTFEVAAKLMRMGARRLRRAPTPAPTAPSSVDEAQSGIVINSSSNQGTSVFGEALQKSNQEKQTQLTANQDSPQPNDKSKKKKHKKKKNPEPEPGSLQYQPKAGEVGKS